MICDVSAMAIDFLATGRPLAVTVPPDPDVVVASTAMLQAVPRVGDADLPGLAGFVAEQVTGDPGRAARQAVTAYYLGDTAPGAAERAFVQATGRMVEECDRRRAQVAANVAAGTRRAGVSGTVGGRRREEAPDDETGVPS
jgi:hypothetical protein